MRIALREQPVALQKLFEVRPRVQPGEPVLPQPRGQSLRQALSVLQALAGVAVVADEVSDASRCIAHRLDDCLVPEQRAVRAIVADEHASRFASLDRLAHALTRLLVSVVALEDAQVGAQNRRDRIAAELRERAVGIDHRAVGSLRIANHDALGRPLDDGAPGCR